MWLYGLQKPDFPGLVPIVQSYLDIIKCDESTATRKQVNKYLELVSKRATGMVSLISGVTSLYFRT